MTTPDPQRPRFSPHRQGLLGVGLALVVLASVLTVLHLRRNTQPVDPGELQMAADSACMVTALRQATAGGRSITYAQLDRLKSGCGE